MGRGIAYLMILGALGGCVAKPVPVEQAMVQCVERARDAAGPSTGVRLGVNSETGPSAGIFIGVTSDFLAGRSPEQTFDRCVREKSGQGPTRPLSFFLS